MSGPVPLRIFAATARRASNVQGVRSMSPSYVSYVGSNTGMKMLHPEKKLEALHKDEVSGHETDETGSEEGRTCGTTRAPLRPRQDPVEDTMFMSTTRNSERDAAEGTFSTTWGKALRGVGSARFRFFTLSGDQMATLTPRTRKLLALGATPTERPRLPPQRWRAPATPRWAHSDSSAEAYPRIRHQTTVPY